MLAAFAWGTENNTSATVAGQNVDCGPPILASWLVAGTDDTGPSGTAADRRRDAACEQVVQRAQKGMLSTMAAGALLALVGWTAYSQPRERPTLAVAHSAPG